MKNKHGDRLIVVEEKDNEFRATIVRDDVVTVKNGFSKSEVETMIAEHKNDRVSFSHFNLHVLDEVLDTMWRRFDDVITIEKIDGTHYVLDDMEMTDEEVECYTQVFEEIWNDIHNC